MLLNQPSSGAVLWITGLSGSGKTTLARSALEKFTSMGIPAVMLNGDEIRRGLCSDLGFSAADRAENIRRVGEVARLFKNVGLVTLVALISPIRKSRQGVRALFEPGEFVEIWCRCPLSVCESRDPKNLYRLARSGVIAEFTGISSNYEPPEHPELVIDTENKSPQQCLDLLFSYIQNHMIPDRQ